MITRVAQRGYSHTGAGKYYLHDKRGDGEKVRTSNKRVDWTHTHNLPTQDPKRAMRWMAYTSMNADVLKEKSGGARCGRKATLGSVYSFSLAWHPDQTPEREEMEKASFSALEYLGLKDHQAVFVAHNDTDHAHVHIITNLVHHETGKRANVGNDQLKLSKWSEEYERTHGKIYCEQRVKNNRQREEMEKSPIRDSRRKEWRDYKKNGKEGPKPEEHGKVKHREKQHKRAELIRQLYAQSDSGKAFRAALEEHNLRLAKGDRRGFVLLDENGKVYSLSRQLKGQRAKDVIERLSDLANLKSVKETRKLIAEPDRVGERKDRQEGKEEAYNREKIGKPKSQKTGEKKKEEWLYDQEQERIDQINAELDAADATARQANRKPLNAHWEKAHLGRKGKEQDNEKSEDQERIRPSVEPFYKSVDLTSKWQQWADKKRDSLEKMQEKVYKRREQVEKVKALEQELAKGGGRFSLTGKFNRLREELAAQKLNLANMDMRIAEQRGTLEKQIESARPQSSNGQDRQGLAADFEAARQKKANEYERLLEQREAHQDRDDTQDYSFDR
ncbi:relaxase/mobilization nuclease domain-containing protein [Lewinella sp. JB7]|uniref:relaxase/mobilization nuclease domain-containing protein n=1 Tax=Lewinella sp. JB7 TaxID=2962887 RepID=UPI0020CA196A|nr:relaxase/mobilization nuclease domain-containing protein [Lewinella sp. JB7]MCP9237907.1 relaxase/mobilization nuclease domain-containing protein [Lewinella sp. JB7]